MAAKKILSDFFDAKSVPEMKIFSYAFTISESILGYILKKQKIICTTTEIRMSPQKYRKDTVFVFELQKFAAHNTKKRRTQHTCAQHANSALITTRTCRKLKTLTRIIWSTPPPSPQQLKIY